MLAVKFLILAVVVALGALGCHRAWRLRHRPPRLRPPSAGFVPGPGDAGVDL